MNRFARRHEHLSAKMAAFLRRGELVFEVNTGRARLDHGFHQFERVQVPSEASFGIGDQGSKPIDSVLSLSMVNLVSAGQRLVDTPDNIRHAIEDRKSTRLNSSHTVI